MKLRPAHLIDFYKSGHKFQYPKGTNLIYSNWTARSGSHFQVPGLTHYLHYGLQGTLKWLFIDLWNSNFFQAPLQTVLDDYSRRMDNGLGPGLVPVDHIRDFHKLGYIPLHVKALPEGSLVPFRVPAITVRNTIDDYFWLTNYVEDMLSCESWKPSTIATLTYEFRKVIQQYAIETGAPLAFCDWQLHDFSFRGMSGVHDAASSNSGHLLSSLGTDTIPAMDYLDDYYRGLETFLGGSVPATEHSVMCMGSKEAEIDTFRRIITELYPTGVVSIVSDTWDYWEIIDKVAPQLSPEILARVPNALGLAKTVFRPDSGDPVKIICGDPEADPSTPAFKGTVELLWDHFGGTTTEKGFKMLNERVGTIYGDSITYDRASRIMQGLKDKGFASSNIVFGIGSFTYQYNTRDSLGFAMKATYGEVNHIPQELFKDPVTDNGVKKSAKGLLRIEEENGTFVLYDQQTWQQEASGALQTVFLDGKLVREESIADIRRRVGFINM